MKEIKTFRIDKELIPKLEKMAKEQGRSVSNLINFILTQATDKAVARTKNRGG